MWVFLGETSARQATFVVAQFALWMTLARSSVLTMMFTNFFGWESGGIIEGWRSYLTWVHFKLHLLFDRQYLYMKMSFLLRTRQTSADSFTWRISRLNRQWHIWIDGPLFGCLFFPDISNAWTEGKNSLYLLWSGVAISVGYVFLFGNIYPSPRRLSGAISCYLGKSLGLLFINIYSLVPVPHLFFFFLSSQVITLGAGRRRRRRRRNRWCEYTVA